MNDPDAITMLLWLCIIAGLFAIGYLVRWGWKVYRRGAPSMATRKPAHDQRNWSKQYMDSIK